MIQQVDRTAGLLDERTITIRGTTSRLTYCALDYRFKVIIVNFIQTQMNLSI